MTLQLTVRLFSACSCSREGSTSEICDQRTGQCSCRQRFIGRQCDRCQVSQIWQMLGQLHMSGHSDCLSDRSSVMDVRSVRCYIHGQWNFFSVVLFSGRGIATTPFWCHPKSIMRTVWSDANLPIFLSLGVFIDGCNAFVGICVCRCSWTGQLPNYKLITTVAFMNDGVFRLFVRTVMCDFCVSNCVLITCWVFPYK